MTSLLEHFIPEAKEYLASATQGLLELERNPSDDGLINEIFRAFHTLKGSSGLFDIPGLTRLVHAGEDLLVDVRSGRLVLDSEIVDLLFDALDRVNAWVDALAQDGQLPGDAEIVSVDLSRKLRTRISSSDDVNNAKANTEVAVENEAFPDWLCDFSDTDRLAIFSAMLASDTPLFAIDYIPDEACFYNGEDPFNLFKQLPGLMALQPVYCREPQDVASVDPFLSTLEFRALVAQPREALAHLFRYVIEQVSIIQLVPEALIVPTGEIGERKIKEDFIENASQLLVKKDWVGVRGMATALLEQIDDRLWEASALRWLNAVLSAPQPNSVWASAMMVCIAEGRNNPILSTLQKPPTSVAQPNPMVARLLAEQRRTLGLAGSDDEIRRRVAGIEATVGAVLSRLNLTELHGELVAAAEAAANGMPTSLDTLLSTLEHRIETTTVPSAIVSDADLVRETNPETSSGKHQRVRILKVDQNKVDALMNQIAELVVFKNSLPFLAKRAEEVYGSREMSREIKNQYAVIDRLAQELQRSIMDVRMLPVSEVFERFTRMVRDLARKLNKHIDLKIVGEETAADKTVIEALGDPLIHLVRNAIDHGIEIPEERADAGKPETGTIQLKAYQEGDRVIIEVSDDGCGIDPEVIRQKAIEKDVISQEKADSLSDQDTINLIFLPGFSTSKEITDLSGRGVGMDVVRTAIEKIGGQVCISSRKGEGSLVQLTLPLSMAVTRVMMVEVAGGLFGLPMDIVAETVRVSREKIRKIKQSEVFVLRNAVIPLVRMNSLLEISDASGAVAEEAVVVVRVGNKTVGLVIDRFREGIDVILKPLDGPLTGLKGYSGSALLGDGHILLVLNLKELL